MSATNCRQAFELALTTYDFLSEKDYPGFKVGWELSELHRYFNQLNYLNSLDPLKPNPLNGWEFT